jgi:PAS domain S-box-containing protein
MESEMETKGDNRTPEQHALVYAENIIATLREPFVVLDKSLRVRTANAVFYRDFHASKEETEGRLLYELGDGQWDIPQLRTLLPQVLSNTHPVEDFEVEHAFPAIGQRVMLLNARRFPPESDDPDLILLAIEDVTDHRRAEAAIKHSEVRYRRLFQKAKDGILILDAETGKVIDANPFMTDLLGYSHEEFLGKELWEIGLFQDIEQSRAAYRELQKTGYVRYEHLPLESRNGQKIEVEFVSNVYAENHHQVVQCNVRDITERSRLLRLTQEQAAALADLDRREDEFLAMLSHELRTPLAPILNAALLLGLHCNRNRQHGIENPVLQQSATII